MTFSYRLRPPEPRNFLPGKLELFFKNLLGVLAQHRRPADLRIVPAEELVRQREGPEFADARVIEAADEPARAHVRVAEDLRDVVHRSDRNLSFIERRDQFGPGE